MAVVDLDESVYFLLGLVSDAVILCLQRSANDLLNLVHISNYDLERPLHITPPNYHMQRGISPLPISFWPPQDPHLPAPSPTPGPPSNPFFPLSVYMSFITSV